MEEKLVKLNAFTRREHTADEVYIFDVILCDNDIDRDTECFSDMALEELKSLFIGKTGIFDHNTSSQNQTARIFDTEIVTTDKQNTKGEVYKCLKASAYMIRTESNADLIKEIDGGIKKEVSISCSAGKHICSVCGTDRKKRACVHIKGTEYGGKKCYVILENIKDAYEWSFVAVPAQPEAGVVKRFTETEEEKNCIVRKSDLDFENTIKILGEKIEEQHKWLDLFSAELKKDVRKLCLVNNTPYGKFIESTLEKLSLEELAEVKKELSKTIKVNVKPQLGNFKMGVN
ncbi:MAG: hypothetical protein LBM93_08680 [Oscillospiraceae bacterium]|jgi:hypothetical protein|nr:hypothetical protein [Oscillospiraceae bacterium]